MYKQRIEFTRIDDVSVTLNTSDLRLLLSRAPPNFHLYLLNDSYSAILGIGYEL